MNLHKTISIILAIATFLAVTAQVTGDVTTSYDAVIEQKSRYTELTEYDYKRVAEEMGIEIAVIKAVSDIEAGKSHSGFVAPGQPTLNFSATMFRKNLRQRGIPLTKSVLSAPALKPLNRGKYGSYGKAQHARLESAMAIDSVSAILSCYWGMFQIGGFNWRKCGCSSPQEFAEKMSESKLMQLELFAHFVTNNGMLKYLKAKNWYGFAKIYNGRNAKKYASRMKAAYNRYK